MDIQSQVSILFDANTQPLRALQSQLNRLSGTLNRSSAATDRQGDSLDRLGRRFSDQGLANIQAGLVQLSNYSLHLSQNLNNMFEKAQNRYVSVDQALNQLRITMGLTGANAVDQMAPNRELVGQYEDIKDTIERLARTTRFTAVELTNLAQNFRRAGKSIDETKSLTNLAQRLTSASGGTLQLTEAGDMLLNTMSATGRTSKDLEVSLDRLVYASQNTRLSVEDMREAYASLSGGLQGLKGDAGELDSFLYSMVAGYKELGKSPREATDAIRQSVAAYTGLFSAVNRAVTRGGGKSTEDALKKAYGRVQIKRNMLLLALGIADGGAELEKVAKKAYGRVTKNTLQAARDLMAQQKLTGPGGAKISGAAFVELVKQARQNLINMGKGAVEVESILKDAFGTQSLVVFSRAVDALERSTGKTFAEVQAQTSKALGDLSKASDESLKSLSSRLKLLESAEDALSNAIFKHDLVAQGAVETYTELVSTAADLAGKNSELAKSIAALGRAAQISAGFVTNLGFALTAMATFSIGLRYAQIDLASSTSTLSRVFSSFYSVFLAPTLAVMVALAGAVGLLGAGFVGYVKRMTGAESTAEGFSMVLSQITNKVKILGGMLRLAFGGEEFGSSTEDMKKYLKHIRDVADMQAKNAKDRIILQSNASAQEKSLARQRIINNKKTIDQINDQNQSVIKALGPETIKAMRTSDSKLLADIFDTGQKAINIFKGVVNFLTAASEPLGAVFSFALETLSASLYILMAPLNAIGWLIDTITNSTEGASIAMRALGAFVGVFFGLKIGLSALVGTFSSVLKIGSLLLSVFNPTKVANYTAQLNLQRANYEALNGRMSTSRSILFQMIEGYQLWQNGIAGATARLTELNQELATQQMSRGMASPEQMVVDAEENLDRARTTERQVRAEARRRSMQADVTYQAEVATGVPTAQAASRRSQAKADATTLHLRALQGVEHFEQEAHQSRQRRDQARANTQNEIDTRARNSRNEAIRDLNLQEDAEGRVTYRTNRRREALTRLGGAVLGVGFAAQVMANSFGFADNQMFNYVNNGVMLIGGLGAAISALQPVIALLGASAWSAFLPFILIGAALGGLIYAVSKASGSKKAKTQQETDAEQATLNLTKTSTPSAMTAPSMATPSTPPDMSSATATAVASRSSFIGAQQPVTKISIENFHSNIKGEAQDPKQFARMIKRELRDSDFMNA